METLDKVDDSSKDKIDSDQGGIDDPALLRGHYPVPEVNFGGLKDLLPQVVLLQQKPERQDRDLILDSFGEHADSHKLARGLYLD
ncbi:MAG: hypothetical protein FJ083_10450 [Cyanobacteria bacterium K_Offshore_surface_m2_239]|nr:hypothetical protein [Cyanobacteria bacterium K_Offshore_surface_m2_239]